MNADMLKAMFKKFNSYIFLMSGRVSFKQQVRYGIGVIYNFLLYNATISDYFELGFYRKRYYEKSNILLRNKHYILRNILIHQNC